MSELTQYTAPMPRGPKPKPPEEVTVNLGLKVLPAIKKEVEGIVDELKPVMPGRITEAWLAHKFFMHGLEAYRKDKKTFGLNLVTRKARPVLSLKKTKTTKKKGVGGNDK